jgi:hypothetical protein
VLGTVLICTKFYNDVFYSNSDIAAISGVHPQELNLIERYTLETLGYSLLVTGEEY